MSQLYQLRQDMYDISSLNNRLKSFNHYLTYLPPLLLNTPLFFYVMPLLNTHNVFLPPPPPPLPPPVYYLSWLIVVLCRQNKIRNTPSFYTARLPCWYQRQFNGIG